MVNPDAGNPEPANLTFDVANAGNPQVTALALLSFCFFVLLFVYGNSFLFH